MSTYEVFNLVIGVVGTTLTLVTVMIMIVDLKDKK